MVYSQLRHGRVSVPGQIYFITTVTYAREPLFRDFLHARQARTAAVLATLADWRCVALAAGAG